MPAWSEIKPALIDLFSSIAIDTPLPFKAEWAGRSRSAMSDIHKFQLFLEVTSVQVFGTDEIRYETDEDTGAVTEAVTGQRQFILRVEAHALEDSDAAHAMHVITRIQTRLRRSRTVEALDAVDVAVAQIGNALNTGYKNAGRVVPRATLDIWLNTSANEDDPIPVGVIEHVEWTSLVADVDGVVSSPPNVTNEMTPPLVP